MNNAPGNAGIAVARDDAKGDVKGDVKDDAPVILWTNESPYYGGCKNCPNFTL